MANRPAPSDEFRRSSSQTWSDALYNILAHGSAQERRRLLEERVPADVKATIFPVFNDSPGLAVVALSMGLTEACRGGNPEEGAALAHAVHRFGVELFQSGKAPGLQLATLCAVAVDYVSANGLLGWSDEIIRFADEWIPFYQRHGDTQFLPSLKAARIDALLNRNQIDEAGEALRDPTLRGSAAADIEIARLQKRYDTLKRPITGTRDAESAPKNDESNRAVQRALQELTQGGLDGLSADARSAARLATLLATAPTAGPSDPASYQAMLDLMREGTSLLTGGSNVENEWVIKGRIRDAMNIFAQPSQTKDELRTSLATLESTLVWSRAHGAIELTNEALWGTYLCHNRLHDPSRAADVLLELRANLEARRAGIADPIERGGVFSEYPHLFNALCEKLWEAQRIPSLLEAIEAAKGRGIADILTKTTSAPMADAAIYAAVGNLPRLALTHCFHYVTFHVDDARTYIVMVTKKGTLFSPEPVPLGRREIRQAAQHADPREWEQPSELDPSVRISNTAVVLSPLVAWLRPLIDRGEVEDGDHLCYVADEDLANIPLHYLRFGDGALADRVSVSKIHGAFHLAALLDADVARPKDFVAAVVPTSQNVAQPTWPAMRQAMWRPVEWLRGVMKGEVLKDVEANLQGISALPLGDRVIHFSTHGVFAENRSPFEHSGLVLAVNGSLPDEAAVANGADGGAVLTPRNVLDASLDLHGSHVSLMSCVSGLSREGLGGDALGLEWALIQAGAASVLASHWYVSARQAAEFFEYFYRHWLSNGKSRAVAHAEAIDTLRRQYGDDNVAAWAAFSLVGDWR